ncbi:septal ring lytic transglycosylase RlpA family lipoprotein [Komagataeibacter xylinus]|uniref:septal ring lytic transglycosylase RlpA family protein n=3 Tax=Komagataeibacter rhaeticus TaxID=215221 RepID=UPI0005868053|nr:septal ring lytic transglycosylase RlpA family protein [Komagataeibacter rhaeticus]ATU73914.1 septal ring lytic transglycosylase RlpA family lipoprotein [Komagataeibacter xylinus]WPP20925.1 septal ring lytic transglycosylase RlpA family protein [Komagataeibacter rhaeticus]
MTGYPDHHGGGEATGHGPVARFAWPVVIACLMLAASGAANAACAVARHGAVMVRHGTRGAARRPPVMSRVPPHWSQHGLASWYGTGRQLGHATASGETFDPDALTAAHTQLPLGTRLLVHSRRTGRSVVVRVNDRGPFRGHRILDLSPEAARQLGILGTGTAPVDIEPADVAADEEVASAPR